MRDYAKVAPTFWTGETGKKLRAAGKDAQLIGLYLMTNPHANMIGLYYLPKMYIAHETGMTFEGASEGLARCSEGGFCTYDEGSEVVYVHEMARYQIADQLDEKDNRCKGIANELSKVPQSPLVARFLRDYGDAFHLGAMKGLARGFKAPPKPRTGTGARTGASEGARDGFEAFWSAYPKHEGKKKAAEVWGKVSPSDELLSVILAAVTLQAKSPQWTKDGGQFIPLPATWLNQRRWEDEGVKLAPPQSGGERMVSEGGMGAWK